MAVLDLVRQGVDVKGVAAFHASLVRLDTPLSPQPEPKAKALILTGNDDASSDSEKVVEPKMNYDQ